MKSEHIVWLLILVAAGGYLVVRAANHQMGYGSYYSRSDGSTVGLKVAELNEHGDKIAKQLKAVDESDAPASVKERERRKLTAQRAQTSIVRTVGIWIGALLTLAIMSFLYRDNIFYRIAEHLFVGMSAAYWMVYAFWTVVVPNVLGKLFPRWTKETFLPGLDLTEIAQDFEIKGWLRGVLDYQPAVDNPYAAPWYLLMSVFYLLPLILGVMLLWRLAPKGQWIARWPLAYIIGITAGLRLPAYLQSDVIAQVEQTILPVVQWRHPIQRLSLDAGKVFYESLGNLVILLGTICTLVYFFFSLEHKGLVGRASRFGIWVLMISFGAGFGYTVMGRITLLLKRFEFLCSDWLNILTG